MNEQNINPDAIMGTSYTNPIPLGIPVKTRIERGEAYAAPQVYKVEVTVLETLRGKTAKEKIQKDGVKISEPKSGYEYLFARLKISYAVGARLTQYVAGGEPFIFSENQFSTYTMDSNREENTPVLQQPHSFLNGGKIPPGESREGWLLLQVFKEDAKPLLVFKRQNVDAVHGIWGSVWFRLF